LATSTHSHTLHSPPVFDFKIHSEIDDEEGEDIRKSTISKRRLDSITPYMSFLIHSYSDLGDLLPDEVIRLMEDQMKKTYDSIQEHNEKHSRKAGRPQLRSHGIISDTNRDSSFVPTAFIFIPNFCLLDVSKEILTVIMNWCEDTQSSGNKEKSSSHSRSKSKKNVNLSQQELNELEERRRLFEARYSTPFNTSLYHVLIEVIRKMQKKYKAPIVLYNM